MAEALKLGGQPTSMGTGSIRRLNRLPLVLALLLVVLFLGVLIYGLSSRGPGSSNSSGLDMLPASGPASTYADQLKKGISDGIIGEPERRLFQPSPVERPAEKTEHVPKPERANVPSETEPDESWRERLEREQHEQLLRERHRQYMASMQAREAATNSPIAVSISRLEEAALTVTPSGLQDGGAILQRSGAMDLYSAAMQSGLGGPASDPNGQLAKEQFLARGVSDTGYLPNPIRPPRSSRELKRGSVIPATLVTGVNSDLPGRVTAQVSRNVYDSATGGHLLIPQGAKLLGRYDSKVAAGQSRVLVVWTDIILPDGSTLQIDAMPGVDAAGFAGFKDKVNNHYLRTFGTAVLVALIGAGTEMMLPQEATPFGRRSGVESAARRGLAESFAQTSEQALSRNLDIQPTLTIRPGYRFNVLVEKDIVFPS